MSPERRHDPEYWNDERPLGRVYFGRNDWLVHARSHLADEQYSPSSTSEVKLFGLSPTGHRDGAHVGVPTAAHRHAPVRAPGGFVLAPRGTVHRSSHDVAAAQCERSQGAVHYR
jgi:hypothetical protein